MAKKYVLVDDIDGSDATETVRVSLDGTEVELDLSEKNAAKVRSLLAPYLEAGRRPQKSYTSTTRKRSPSNGPGPNPNIQAIRDWANKNGFTVSNRGAIAKNVLEAFDKAHDAEGALTGKSKAAAPKAVEKKDEPAFSAAAK